MGLDNPVPRLGVIVQFPMPVRVGIRRVEDRPLEKAFHVYVSLPRRSVGAALG